MSIEKDLFRRVMGSFASGVTVVTVKVKDAEPTGFTANAVTSLSIEPRMLLVCVNEQSSTLSLIEEAGKFCGQYSLGQAARDRAAVRYSPRQPL